MKQPTTSLGKTIVEAMRAVGDMSQTELAEHMGRPIKTINEIIHGKTGLTVETALQLETVLFAPAHFWMGLHTADLIAAARAKAPQPTPSA